MSKFTETEMRQFAEEFNLDYHIKRKLIEAFLQDKDSLEDGIESFHRYIKLNVMAT